MEFKLTLALPRDNQSVPITRRVLKNSLVVLGVRDEYEVSAGVDGTACVIEVVDRGQGFDGSAKGLSDAEPSAEDGRGVQLMRALVDKATFISRPAEGTVVHLEKELEWDRDAPIKRLTEDRPATEHGPWSHDERLDEPEPVRRRR